MCPTTKANPKGPKIEKNQSPFATPPACYRSLSGPSGPKCPGSVPRGVPRGVSRVLRARGSGVSKKCPESVPGVSGHLFDTPGTLSGHFLDTPERQPGARRAPETPRGTGTLRARRARETPVAGRGGRRSPLKFSISIEIFNPGPSEFPTKKKVWRVARLKISISIENFNPGGRS